MGSICLLVSRLKGFKRELELHCVDEDIKRNFWRTSWDQHSMNRYLQNVAQWCDEAKEGINDNDPVGPLPGVVLDSTSHSGRIFVL
jgi:hypothetical protein